MRTETVTTKIYSFDELSSEAQAKALDNCRDFNTSDNWWEFQYEDAANSGLKITSFDLNRNRHAKGCFENGAKECADLIIDNHGESCETYRTTQAFIKKWEKIDSETQENEEDELEREFLKDILEDYSIMLQNQYEYLYEDEAVQETIESNEYEFTENGTQY